MADLVVEEEVEVTTEPWDLDDQTFYSNIKNNKMVNKFLKNNSIPMDNDYIDEFSNILLDENVVIDSSELIIEHENDVQNINISDVNLLEGFMILKDNIRRETEQRESGKKMRKNDHIIAEPKIGLTKHINPSIIPRTSTRVSIKGSRKAQPTSASEENEKDTEEHVVPVTDFISRTRESGRVQPTFYSEEYEKNMEEQIASATYSVSQSTIPCKTCSVDFSSREDLFNHMTRCHKQKLLECGNCDFTSVYKRSLKDHEERHSQIEYFKCQFCEFSTNYILAFKNHDLLHTQLNPLSCDECPFRTKSKNKLRKHKKLHSGDMSFSCSYCDYKAVKRSRIVRHELIHTGERPYACPHCDFSSNQRCTLKIHIRIHTGEKPYECNLCSFKAISKGSLNAHLKKHNSRKNKKFICSVCEQIYFTETAFLKHEKSHEKEAAIGGYMKPITNKKRKADYLAENALSSSISTVPPKQEKKIRRNSSSSTIKSKKSEEVVENISTSPIVKLYECWKCSYRFSTYNELSDHLSSHKESENTRSSSVIPKEYRCTPCNLSFSSNREMKHHLKEKHIKKNKEITINIGEYDCEE